MKKQRKLPLFILFMQVDEEGIMRGFSVCAKFNAKNRIPKDCIT